MKKSILIASRKKNQVGAGSTEISLSSLGSVSSKSSSSPGGDEPKKNNLLDCKNYDWFINY